MARNHNANTGLSGQAHIATDAISPITDWLHTEATAWAVLAISLLITMFSWWFAADYIEERAQERFNVEVSQAKEAILKRMTEYEQVLRGGVGLFVSSENITREKWRQYVGNLEINTYWPGIQGIGYAVMISPEKRETLIRSMREEGFPDFTINPPGVREEYSSIVFLEPLDWRNKRAIGYDMFSEPTRQTAMAQARDSGKPAVSGKVKLVQETDKDVQAGFLMYLPHYRQGMPLETPAQRRAALAGFVYSPFRAKDLLNGILGPRSPLIDFKIYDGETSTEDSLLYASPQSSGQNLPHPKYIAEERMELPGRTWSVRFNSSTELERELTSYQPMLIGFGGTGIDLLLFWVIWSLSKRRQQALRTASEMTALVDQLRKSETELALQAERAKAANRAKSDFLANMSHEIRTPMNAVMGLTQLLMDTNLDVRQQDYLTKLNDSVRSLLWLLNDILDYSKIEAGKLELESVEFELAETLESTAGLFNLAAEQKGLELVFDVAPDTPQFLVGDPLRFKQIISNLLGNAIKFTKEGHVKLSIQPQERHGDTLTLKISVSDTGIGMSTGQIEKLFRAFEQADTSTTRKFGGTGLGLTIARTLIEMMGGEISIESEPGRGSTFTCTIRVKVSAKPAKQRTAASLRGMHTLIIDDQEVASDMMKNLMAAWSFDADVAYSGEKGLEMALEALRQGKPYELILVDWKLPGMDGVELARRLRQEEKNIHDAHHAIVIMVTAYGRQDAQRATHEVKFDAILDKPVMASHLLDTIAGLQGSGRSAKTLEQWGDLQHCRSLMQPIRSSTVLLVEDNPTNQMVAREILEILGLRITIANNGLEAVEKASTRCFDAILMDLQMPEMDGLEASKLIRSLPQCPDVPIIAMTAAALLDDRLACQAAGMNDFVSKPIDVTELTTVLLRWVPPKTRETATPTDEMRPIEGHDSAFTVAGLTLSSAIQRMGGDWGMLRRVVDGFARDFAASAEEMDGLISSGRWADARRLAHTVKSMAKSVGANELSDISEQLERELEARQYASVQVFKALLNKTLDAIATLPPVKPLSSSPPAPSRMVEILHEIWLTIGRSGFVQPGLLEEFALGLSGEKATVLCKQLLLQIKAFDYPNARNTLIEIAAIYQVDLGNNT